MKAISQDEHAKINAREYPGTRQLCSKCDDPTGRCEEDSMTDKDGNILCESCYSSIEITWTNCMDEMPPDDETLIIARYSENMIRCQQIFLSWLANYQKKLTAKLQYILRPTHQKNWRS